MKSKGSLAAIPLVLGLAFGAQEASAAPCVAADISGGGGDALHAGSPGAIRTGDVTFGVTPSPAVPADSCAALYDGNETLAEIKLIGAQLGWGTDFVRGPKSDDGASDSASVLGVVWGISYGGSGSWTLTFAGDGFPLAVDLVVALKQSQGWAAFLFDDVALTADGSGSGQFVIRWCPGQSPLEESKSCDPDTVATTGLSHLGIFLQGQDTRVPEPGSLMLLWLALAGLALARRRRPA